MRRRAGIALLLCIAFCGLPPWTASRAEMIYAYSVGDNVNRNNFITALLKAALERTSAKYGSYAVRPLSEVPRYRQIRDLDSDSGDITLALLGTVRKMGAHLRPILIPVDKGLLGYRLLLIRRSMRQSFEATRSVEGLKRFTFGQNFAWDDVDILRANGLKVETGDDFEGLYQMLARQRFDAFPRGIGEIASEFNVRANPALEIEKSLLIYYPLPTYFWFARTPHGEELAKRLEEGMWSMIADGSYDTLLWKYCRPSFQGLDLAHRRFIVLENPLLPEETPLKDPRLWVSPAQLGVMAGAHF